MSIRTRYGLAAERVAARARNAGVASTFTAGPSAPPLGRRSALPSPVCDGLQAATITADATSSAAAERCVGPVPILLIPDPTNRSSQSNPRKLPVPHPDSDPEVSASPAP